MHATGSHEDETWRHAKLLSPVSLLIFKVIFPLIVHLVVIEVLASPLSSQFSVPLSTGSNVPSARLCSA